MGRKGEDNMYRKRAREGVWSSYINNNVSNISHPSLPPRNPAQMVSVKQSPSKLSKYIYWNKTEPFLISNRKNSLPPFFCPPSIIRLINCSFFCHIFHHPKPFTSFIPPPKKKSYDWWGVTGWGRNNKTRMNGGGV